MHDRTFILFLAAILSSVFFLLSVAPQARCDRIIVIAPPLDDAGQGSVVAKAPTSFTDVIRPGDSSPGLIDTAEALRMASSVDLADYGGAATSPVTLRGSNFQQTLLSLDGVPLTPVTGDMVDLSRYALPGIEQVEIVKGSNSAVFGKSAMGGVINLVTRKPGPRDSLDFTSSQGSYGYGLYHAQATVHAGQAGILADITRSFADNDFRYERDDGTWKRRENNDVENTTGLLKMVFDAQGWDTSIMGNVIDHKMGSPGSEGSAGLITPADRVSAVQSTCLVETEKTLSPDQSMGLRAWFLGNRMHTESIPFGDSRTKIMNRGMAVSYSVNAGPFCISPKAEYLLERMNSDDYGTHSRRTATGTLAVNLDASPAFVELATRYDDSSDFGPRWTYHAGATLSVTDYLLVKANAGTGYREPTMGQLYAPSTWYTFVPNPGLDPERSFSWDIGPSASFGTFGTGVNYFFTSYRDLIKMSFPGPNQFSYVNVDRARGSGIEAYFWVAPARLVKLSSNYLLSRYTYESGAYDGNVIKQKPEQVLNLQADIFPVIWKRSTTITIAYQFREGSYADEANTFKTGNRDILNAALVVEVNKNTSVSFKADNILGDSAPEYVDKSPWGTFWYPLPGRMYRFAAQVSF